MSRILQNIFNVQGWERLKLSVLAKAWCCCHWVTAVWVLSLRLPLPESGEHIISARLGFLSYIVLLGSQERVVSVHLPDSNARSKPEIQCKRVLFFLSLTWDLSCVVAVRKTLYTPWLARRSPEPHIPSLVQHDGRDLSRRPKLAVIPPVKNATDSFQKQGLNLASGSSAQKAFSLDDQEQYLAKPAHSRIWIAAKSVAWAAGLTSHVKCKWCWA